MATYSTLLGLKLNAESDPFELNDFIQNWELLDASPGVYVCTSTSRPSWGSAQAGRMIFMKDIKQLSYWSGSGWNDLRDSAPVFVGGTYLGTKINPGATPVYNILTFTTPRPCSIAIWLSATYNYPNDKTQDSYQECMFDGTLATIGSYREQIRFAGNSGDSGDQAGVNAVSMGLVPSVSAGQHKVGIRVDMGSFYKTAITLVGVKAIAMISLYSSGNTL